MWKAAAFVLATAVPAQADYRVPVEELVGEISKPAKVIAASIASDCRYAHPDRAGVRSACISRERGHYGQVWSIWRNSDAKTRAIVLLCMDTNRALSGFEWADVSSCFERMAIDQRIRIVRP